MKLGLGIDTGGTYTDAVIYDFEGNSIADVSKTLTTKENLEYCISRALDGLSAKLLREVKAVSLSTTLATNACIEGRGQRARLVLIGCDRRIAESYGQEYGLPPSDEIIFLEGGHDQKGDVVAEPDWEFLKTEITGHINEYDAYAVVEIWGMNNCGFEVKARDLIIGLTGRKVVCGHELTARLNLFKRAASALLNAQLIPLVSGFITSILKNLRARGIDAPLTIMRGDGSLMSEDFARERPVETLLCGPAASVEGGINLTGEKNCVIIDMGGTTTDMAIVRNLHPRLAEEGAAVGKWRTGTHSILIETTGLGGDSRIGFESDFSLTLGPDRVIPLSFAASRWPAVADRAEQIMKEGKKSIHPSCEFIYSTAVIDDNPFFNDKEKRIARELFDKPIDITSAEEEFELSMTINGTKRLEDSGILVRIGLTPTDIMHISGDYEEWDRKTAAVGARCLAKQLGTDYLELGNEVYKMVRERIFLGAAKILIEDEDKSIISDGMSAQLKKVLLDGFRKSLDDENGHTFGVNFRTAFSLVGIGAPVHVFLGDVAKAMGAECVIPEKAAVANAVGAITGKIRTKSTSTVFPHYSTSGIQGYSVFSSGSKEDFRDYEKALSHAKKTAWDNALSINEGKGAVDSEVTVDIYENTARPSASKEDGKTKNGDDSGYFSGKVLIETVVTAVAAGYPSGRQ